MSEATIYNYALSLLAKREYCVSELTSKLNKKFIQEKDYVQKTIGQLIQKKFVDDQRYVAAFLRHRQLLGQKSLALIKLELKAKKITEENIQAVLDKATWNEQAQIALLYHRKKKGWEKWPPEERTERIIRYLAGKGFNYGDIKDFLQQENRND